MAEMDYGQIKDKLIVELVGADRNAEMLKQVPHTMVEDMAAIYKVRLDSDAHHQTTMTVTNEIQSALGVDVQQLHQDALENAAQISPAKVHNMAEVLGLPPDMSLGGSELIVVTTENQIKGAGALLYSSVMDQIAKKAGGDFFVLPSSVHEVLALPDSGNITPADLQEMVMAVNGSEVASEEQLSDHVYHFDAKERVFELAEKFEARQEAKENERPSVLKELADKQKNVVNEPGLYTLVLRSRKAEAKQFKRWITHEVLPTIRKHDAYMTDSVLEQVMENPDTIYSLAAQLLEDKAKCEELSRQLKEAQPKAEYVDSFIRADGCICIRYCGKEFGIPQNTFVKLMLEHKYLYRDQKNRLMPFADKQARGFFIVRDFYTPDGVLGQQTLVTCKGKEHIRRQLKKWGIIA